MSQKLIDIQIGSAESYELHLECTISAQGEVENSKLYVVGGPDLLELACVLRQQLTGPLTELVLPKGQSTAAIVIRELILKAQGQWVDPFEGDELCHCRAVATRLVDEAVIYGAHTTDVVSEKTSAGTSCGSCREDIESIINYRLKIN